MPACPTCAAELPDTSTSARAARRRCPGPTDVTRLTSPDGTATRPASGSPVRTGHTAVATTSSWLTSTDAIDHGRFAPGTILDGRYRIVGRLGKGGMGEVYRADDLKLGQPVALKFLPEVVDRDPARLTQLHTEVRMARQVSHPNVCRVYDVGEFEGHTFLSMEYVDGEDLSSLLRRIGRFPEDRAIEVARQICAGLAAAHERGVVHRDLKPANIMLDGSGRIRDHRLRPRRRGRRNAARRHAGLHGAGAARRRRGHAAQRHLRARAGALRDVHRAARARRPQPRRADRQARAGRHHAAVRDRPRPRSRDRPRDHALPRAGSRAAVPRRRWRWPRRCPAAIRWPRRSRPAKRRRRKWSRPPARRAR